MSNPGRILKGALLYSLEEGVGKTSKEKRGSFKEILSSKNIFDSFSVSGRIIVKAFLKSIL